MEYIHCKFKACMSADVIQGACSIEIVEISELLRFDAANLAKISSSKFFSRAG